MVQIYNSKFIEIKFGYKSWSIGIDWEVNEYTRPIYITILCFTFMFGKDPYLI